MLFSPLKHRMREMAELSEIFLHETNGKPYEFIYNYSAYDFGKLF